MPNTRPAQPRHAVQIDIALFQDLEMHRRGSLWAMHAYVQSLFHLAGIDEPDGIYPHALHAIELGRHADQAARDLIDLGIWEDVGLGYRVSPYCGWAVRPVLRVAITAATRCLVYARDGHLCVVCGSGTNLSLDHIVPWSTGGSDEPSNLQTMCRSCNSRKGNRT